MSTREMEATCEQNPKFLLDSMLGRLNKWLRVLGYDSICRHLLDRETAFPDLRVGRILLTRHRMLARRFEWAVLLNENHVGNQLAELKRRVGLTPDRSLWFSRCLVCNTRLTGASPEKIRERVPDYVYRENVLKIRFCASCGRCYWPGTHRDRMEKQLCEWGFGNCPITPLLREDHYEHCHRGRGKPL